jgi:hypothetical protein
MELHAGTYSVTTRIHDALNDLFLPRIYFCVPQFRFVYPGVIGIRRHVPDPANFPWNLFGNCWHPEFPFPSGAIISDRNRP